jgi:hypothetical protein
MTSGTKLAAQIMLIVRSTTGTGDALVPEVV